MQHEELKDALEHHWSIDIGIQGKQRDLATKLSNFQLVLKGLNLKGYFKGSS